MTNHRLYSPRSTGTVCKNDSTKLADVPTEGIGGRGLGGAPQQKRWESRVKMMMLDVGGWMVATLVRRRASTSSRTRQKRSRNCKGKMGMEMEGQGCKVETKIDGPHQASHSVQFRKPGLSCRSREASTIGYLLYSIRR